MTCTVEILSIGNELLLGNTVNTNAAWIATQVTKLGGRVTRITTVADNLDEISKAVLEAVRRHPDFVITTGGIGPTFDDITLKAVARAIEVRLKLDDSAVAMVREHYARRFPNRRIVLTKPRLKMAYIPLGGTPLPNPIGTAPGVRLSVRNTEICCLPGVPREAKAIFVDSLSEPIGAAAGGVRFVEKWLRVQGVMESSLAPIIDQVMGKWRGVYIKSHPRGAEGRGGPFLELHFSTSSTDSKRAERVLVRAISDTVRLLSNLRAMVKQIRSPSILS